jgi:2-polyprenyl-3-methyl-5-hydroxy-6-metoxy-1,4-benzoquinol methylase
MELYQTPALYDRLVLPGPCERFYSDLARTAGGRILELACGTGRLTVPLAKQASLCVGLDSSAAMLKCAREKALAAGARVDFLLADMAEFDLCQQFDLIVMSCNSMAHLLTDQQLGSCLRSIRCHLSRNGVFAFDVVNPRRKLLSRTRKMRLKRALSSPELRVREEVHYDEKSRICEAKMNVHDRNGTTYELGALFLRQRFPDELTGLLAQSGLTLLARYGDFDRRKFSSASGQQICIAQRSCRENVAG